MEKTRGKVTNPYEAFFTISSLQSSGCHASGDCLQPRELFNDNTISDDDFSYDFLGALRIHAHGRPDNDGRHDFGHR